MISRGVVALLAVELFEAIAIRVVDGSNDPITKLPERGRTLQLPEQ